MRYLVATLVAALVIGLGVLYVWWANRSVEANSRRTLHEQQQAGNLSPELQGIDFETADLRGVPPDMQMRVSSKDLFRIQSAMWLTDFWYVLAPLTLVVCLAVAGWLGKRFEPTAG